MRVARIITAFFVVVILILIALAIAESFAELGLWMDFNFPAVGEDKSAEAFITQLGIALLATVFLYMLLTALDD